MRQRVRQITSTHAVGNATRRSVDSIDALRRVLLDRRKTKRQATGYLTLPYSRRSIPQPSAAPAHLLPPQAPM